MDEAVENGIGDGWIGEGGVPLIDGQLAGDEGAFLVIPVVQDLQQIALRRFGERTTSEVVEDDEIEFGELPEVGAFALQGAGPCQLIGQPG